MKKKIEIEIRHIEVEETSKNRGWYCFDYTISMNGKKPKTDSIDGSWSNQTKKEFEKVLKKDWAVTLVIQHCFA